MSPRARSPSTGTYQGVGFLSSFPARVVAQAWPPEVYQTSRVQARLPLSLLGISGFWGVFVMDLPLTRVVPDPSWMLFWTGFSLNLSARALWQEIGIWSYMSCLNLSCSGPGRAERTGHAAEATCKGKTRKDFLFVSPELQATFLEARIDPTFWPDHSLVSASFEIPREHIAFFSWRQPVPRFTDEKVALSVPFVLSGGDASERYAHVCRIYEDAVSTAEQQAGRPPLSAAERGRGIVQQVRCRRTTVVPHRRGRQGDVEPLFFGCSVQRSHWFRQVRRVQALVQSLKSGRIAPAGLDHRDGLWKSILGAPGFPGSFQAWWRTREVQLLEDCLDIPAACPQLGVAQQIFLSFEANFRKFEAFLLGRRKASAVKRRKEDPSLIFRDLQLPPRAPVESLVEAASAEVTEVCEEEQALDLEEQSAWAEGLPFTCDGMPLHVVHAEPDKVWVSTIAGLVPGMRVEQARLIGSLLDFFF